MEFVVSPENHNQIERPSPPAAENCVFHSALPPPHRLERSETDPDVVARLEWLDDLMFAAIDGDAGSLETVGDAWKNILGELGWEAVEESRRQYLRRAQSVWNELRHQPNHPPHKVFAAIEIISLLAGKAW